MSDNEEKVTPKIVIRRDGAYKVYGSIPLVHKTQVVSEYGEPLTWKKDFEYPLKAEYSLCRCGRSKEMPYCDSAHNDFDFDGTETADTHTHAERQVELEGGKGIIVKKDDYLCMNSGFCGNRLTNIDEMIARTDEPAVRAEIIAMIERCPSAAYVYAMKTGEPDIEPDLPMQIAETTEITEYGPIEGPLWVTGNIPIERADGQPFETHNRVTLCNCGESCKKPFCDGTHRTLQEEKLKKQIG
jgi:CDGSH-type Zn-finger protein